MLVFNPADSTYIIDPHYWTLIPFKNIRDKDTSKNKQISQAKVLWIYHMYNPHSPFRDYRNKDKSAAIVAATFPKAFVEEQEKALQHLIDEANAKNKDLDSLSDTVVEGSEVVVKKKEYAHVPTLRTYDPLDDEDVSAAAEWYQQDHLQSTPLWYSYESYKESMYNLSDIIRDKNTSATNIRAASQELDTIPLKMEKMKQQAIKDEAVTLKIAGDRNIKRGERIESHASRRAKDKAAQVKTD